MLKYLQDKDFLKQICAKKNRSISVRIIAYTKNDEPIEYIQGKVTSGSINLDGTSNTRRSCSLSLISTNLDIHDFYWSLNTRFSIEIGLTNDTNQYSEYNIIWFPMGYYLISSFSINVSTNTTTINISGKDKMCLLNGEIGGKINASTDFGTEDIIQEDGSIVNHQIPIKTIIKEMVHEWGEEPYAKIIINDVDDYGLNLETYKGDTPIYLFLNTNNTEQACFIEFTGDREVDFQGIKYKLDDLPIQAFWYQTGVEGTVFNINNQDYYIRKISYGETIGYGLTNLTYPGDLIANIGDTITSILDKIKNMLGDFEYFYDINGNFIFQKQKAYKTNNELMSLTQDMDGLIYSYDNEPTDLTLSDLGLITSLSNSPQISNIKNDFTLWGTKKGITGADLPIHIRYAIDNKPISYATIEISENKNAELLTKYTNLKPSNSKIYTTDEYDWRELIYQMAKDYRKLHYIDEYPDLLYQFNKQYQGGKTGYEQYYIDLEGFWRQLYQPDWEQVEYDIKSGVVDFIKPNIIYKLIDCENKNGELIPIDNEITLLNSDYYKNFAHKDGYIHLYGPLMQKGDSVVRQYYGPLNSILENNYKILQKIYLNKGFLKCQDKKLSNSLTALKNESQLYYYDGNTCIIDDDNTYSSWQEMYNAVDDYTDLKNADIKQCYHPLIINGNSLIVEPYLKWKDSSHKEAILSESIDFFALPQEWYYKVTVEDGDNIIEDFRSIGKYYPISAKKIEITEEQSLKIKKSIAKNYTKEKLLSLLPEDSKISLVKNIGMTQKYLQEFLTDEEYYYFNVIYNLVVNYYSTLLIEEITKNSDKYKEIVEKIGKNSTIVRARMNILKNLNEETIPTKTNKEAELAQQITDELDNLIQETNLLKDEFLEEYQNSSLVKALTSQYSYFFTKVQLNEDDFSKELEQTEFSDDGQKILENTIIQAYTKIGDLQEELKVSYDLEPFSFPMIFSSLKQNTEDKNIAFIKSMVEDIITSDDKDKTSTFFTWPVNFDIHSKYNNDILYAPENLIFWFDFLNNEGEEIQKYSIKNIGQRQYVKNDNQVKVINYLPTLNNLFVDFSDEEIDFSNYDKFKNIKTGYYYLECNDIRPGVAKLSFDCKKLLSLSSQGKTALSTIENLIYNYAYAVEPVSITCIPQYFLQPNTKIAIYDNQSKISGEYIITKISMSLNYNGTMSLTATKAPNKYERSEILNVK